MGLVRAGALPQAAPPELAAEDAALSRRREAHALGQVPGAEGDLGHRLQIETDPSVRAALFLALVAQGSLAAVEVLAEILHAEDAGLRNGAIDALAALPEQAATVLDRLLADPDPGMRMFGVLLAGDLPLPGIELTLFALLNGEQDPNVCATLLEVLLGRGQPLPATLHAATAHRFRTDPFVQFLLSDAQVLESASPGERS